MLDRITLLLDGLPPALQKREGIPFIRLNNGSLLVVYEDRRGDVVVRKHGRRRNVDDAVMAFCASVCDSVTSVLRL